MQELQERVVYSVTRQSWLESLAHRLQQAVNGVFTGSPVGRRVKDFLNGVWLAHPLHPAVTDVPIGAWTTALALDGAEIVTGRPMPQATSTAIGLGIGGAVASAMSGIADWSDTYGEQRRVGLVHAGLNSLALVLYSASLWRRLNGHHASGKALSALGYLSVFSGAYLGGELVYRLGTQVDRNAYTPGPREFVPVMNASDLPEDKPTRVEAKGVPVLLVRHGSQIHALNDVCSHQGCSLAEGNLQDGNIVCRCHGSTYRLEDGSVVHGPAPYAQPHYQVQVVNGQIEVRTDLQ